MVDAGDLARDAVARAREQRLIETAERNDNPPPPISVYAGFDCKTGEALLRPVGGGIVRGQPLYNTAVRPGDIMDLHVSQGLPKADSLSAWEPESEPVVEEKEKEVFGELIILYRTPDGGLWIGGDRAKPKRIGAWDAAREWSISKNSAKENGYVVTGLSRGTPELTPQILRYGGGRSFTIDNETGRVIPLFKIPGGAVVTSTFDIDDLIVSGNQQENPNGSGLLYGMVSASLFNVTGQYSNVVTPTSVNRTIQNNGAIVAYAETISNTGGYSHSYNESGTSSPSGASGSVSASFASTIRTNLVLESTSTFYQDDTTPPTFTNNYILSISYVGAKLSSTIYSRYSFNTASPDPPTTKHYINNTELSKVPAFNLFGSRVTLANDVFYQAMGADFRLSSFAYVKIHRIVEAEFKKTEEITVPFFPIPQDATVIDWSYHP